MRSSPSHIFPFIRYVKPAWYFNLAGKRSYPLWVNYDLLDETSRQLLSYDKNYSSHEAALRDAAYQALQKGMIFFDNTLALKITEEPTIADNYRFVRKYFNKNWALLICLIRLFSLVNPVRELKAFFSTTKTGHVNVFSGHCDYKDELSSTSSLLSSQPKVSVIIPTLNRYIYLKDVLNDLAHQTYTNFEVLICDQSDPVDVAFYREFDSLDIRLIVQKEKALWRARNRCIVESSGEYILLFDDDSRVESNWIENHLRCLDFFKVEISSGVSLSKVGAKIPAHYAYYRWSDQLDTGNVMVRKSVFRETGLFDRQFEKQRMGDGEFGLRCYLAGFKNISNPSAQRLHLKVSSGGLRQMGSWDAWRPKNVLAPRPIPSVLYLVRKYFGSGSALLFVLTELPVSIMPYKFKGSKMGGLLSLLIFIFLWPLFLFQVARSLGRATKMLRVGALIDTL